MNVLKSRRFWSLVVDMVVSLVVYLVGKYAAPSAAEDIIKIIAIIQPVAITLIIALTVDDVKGNTARINADRDVQMRAIDTGQHPDFQPEPAQYTEGVPPAGYVNPVRADRP